MQATVKIGLALLGLLAGSPGFALYKVVGPDGKVSYTDRPPPAETAKVETLRSFAGSGTPDSALPFDLRQVVQRYPVTLYTTSDCAPCDSARALLRQRGVPHTEKTVSTPGDSAAFKRLGGQSLPLLTIGAQQMRRFSAEEWNNYLGAAGYPAQSQLPRNYSFAAATPLAPPAPAASAPAPAPERPTAPPPAPPQGNAPPGFRF